MCGIFALLALSINTVDMSSEEIRDKVWVEY